MTPEFGLGAALVRPEYGLCYARNECIVAPTAFSLRVVHGGFRTGRDDAKQSQVRSSGEEVEGQHVRAVKCKKQRDGRVACVRKLRYTSAALMKEMGERTGAAMAS